MSQKVVVTRGVVGVCHMQVCAESDATDEDILAACNRENPSGTSAGWTKVCRANSEAWPKVAPVPCQDDPSRTHFLVAC